MGLGGTGVRFSFHPRTIAKPMESNPCEDHAQAAETEAFSSTRYEMDQGAAWPVEDGVS